MRTRIKMCGMTRVEDVEFACKLGIDAIGINFYPPSPRCVSLAVAEELSRSASLMVDRVALFVNPDPGFVTEVLAATGAEIIQFHGDESADFCQQFNMPYIKALRVKSSDDVQKLVTPFAAANAILLDAFVEGVPGGTGESFDWSLIPVDIRSRLMLAGGLTPQNVASAIVKVRPFAVDVSGGIEVDKGIKANGKMTEFVQQVAVADQSVSEYSS